MSDEKPTTMRDLEKRVEEDVREWMAESPEDRPDESEIAHEIADRITPVYNYTLFEVLLSDTDLWYAESETGAGAEDPTPVSIVQAVVYDALRQKAYEVIRQVEEEWEYAREEAEEAKAEAIREERMMGDDIREVW